MDNTVTVPFSARVYQNQMKPAMVAWAMQHDDNLAKRFPPDSMLEAFACVDPTRVPYRVGSLNSEVLSGEHLTLAHGRFDGHREQTD